MDGERTALLLRPSPKGSHAHVSPGTVSIEPSLSRLAAQEEASTQALSLLVERRLSSLRSLTLVAALLFGFATSVMALGTTEFNSSDTRHWYVALLSVTVTLSAFALMTYLVHAAICDRLVAEGVPEYAWRLLVKVPSCEEERGREPRGREMEMEREKYIT
jgi:hypothetical protein